MKNKTIKLVPEASVPSGLLIAVHGKTLKVYIPGRDTMNPNSFKKGTLVYACPETAQRVKTAMRESLQ